MYVCMYVCMYVRIVLPEATLLVGLQDRHPQKCFCARLAEGLVLTAVRKGAIALIIVHY